jgi:hypothetical protein
MWAVAANDSSDLYCGWRQQRQQQQQWQHMRRLLMAASRMHHA